MSFRQNSPRKQKKLSKRASDGSGATGARKNSGPLARQRSLQQIAVEVQDFDASPWGDTDDEYHPDENDPIVLSDDNDIPLAAKKRKGVTGPAKALARRDTEIIDIDRVDTASPVERCFKALKALQSAVRPWSSCPDKPDGAQIFSKNKNAPALHEETLQFIAATMPASQCY